MAASAVASEPRGSAADLTDPDLRAYAAAGSAVAGNLGLPSLPWSDAQFDAFLSGFRAARAGHPYPMDGRGRQLFEDIGRHLTGAGSPRDQPDPDPLSRYLQSLKQELTLQETASGLLYRLDQAGAGPRPRPVDTVVLNVAAKGPDGTTALPMLSGKATRVDVAALLPGLAEAVQMLALGGRIFVVLPPDLSFDKNDWPTGVPAGAPLMFDIELVDIITTAGR